MTETGDGESETASGFDWRDFTPDDSPMTPVDIAADPRSEDLHTADLGVGDPAHGFSRPVYDFTDGTRQAVGTEFDLLSVAAEKPVALIFGSYT